MRHQEQVNSNAIGVDDGSSAPVAAAVSPSHVVRDQKGQGEHDANERDASVRKTNGTSNRTGKRKRGRQPSPGGAEILPVKSLRTTGSPVAAEGTWTRMVAELLSSKSNYQHIVDGSYSQFGLSYPERLSRDLNSKRTSHKTAEQDRRDRMKTALQKMAKLLPQTASATDGTDGDENNNTYRGGRSGSGSDGNDCSKADSKAGTVEMATEYIMSLQKEIMEMKRILEENGQQQRRQG